jgi:transcriptional/translational regulatory protein YebC/TACO1
VLSFDPGRGDALLEAALEAGASDVVEGSESVEVVTAAGELDAVRAKLEAAGFPATASEVSMEPSTTVKIEGEDAEKMLRLAEALDDLDDVQAVYANFDISEAEMARLA